MKVLFLEIDTETDWVVASLGPAFLAAYLRQHGHEAVFCRVPMDMSDEDLVACVRREAPGLIGLSLTTRQWLRARAIVTGLRAAVDVPVVAGGLQPTFSPEAVIAHPGIDYVCLGEGETPLLDLVAALDRGDAPRDGEIENIWVTGGRRPAMRPPYEPIDELPFMARDFLDEHSGVVHMTTQRGCPFPCTYCGARMYNQLYEGNGTYGRRRSHGNVIDELWAIREADGLSYAIFLDDTFTINHPWVAAFCDIYGAELAVPFSLHARVETVNERMLHQLAAAGCHLINYGVESGSPRVRREIMKRSTSNQRLIDVFRWTREAGIMTTANYMLGLPGETREEMQQTIDLHHAIEPDEFGYFVFYPYPGTPLFHHCRQHGYLPENYLDLPANHRESILDLPDISKQDITEMYDRWTAVRVANGWRRFAGGDHEGGRRVIANHIEAHAASG